MSSHQVRELTSSGPETQSLSDSQESGYSQGFDPAITVLLPRLTMIIVIAETSDLRCCSDKLPVAALGYVDPDVLDILSSYTPDDLVV